MTCVATSMANVTEQPWALYQPPTLHRASNCASFWYTFIQELPACVLLADCPELQPCSTCVMGQEECQAEGAGGRDKLMRQGNHDNDYKWELIDLSNSSVPNCPLFDYPFPISYPAAIMFDDEAGVVRACGGYIPSKEEGGGGVHQHRQVLHL